MRPFALMGAEDVTPASFDIAEYAAKRKRDVEFFAKRGIVIAEDVDMALPTKSTEHKSTQTIVPTQDSDADSIEILDD
jgi:hypothetical protein